ncbi:hypothetical protein [Amycolatopsis sp. NPDC051071]
MESQGMIDRNPESGNTEVTVINRSALLSLRRQWDQIQFPLDDAEL